SGFVSLIYEMCWIRKSSEIFGSTIYAASSVIAIFFTGLALGNYLAGQFIQKINNPLKTYGILELILGCFALANPFLFLWSDSLYSFIYPWFMHNFWMLSFIRFIVIAGILLPPTILMGATLPLFVQHFIRTNNTLSFFIPLLYALNTFGAFWGSIVAGFFLIKSIGITYSIISGAVINLCIGLFMTASRPALQGDVIKKAETTAISNGQESLSRSVIGLVSLLFFASGFLALGYEMLWTRYLTLIIHNTIYTYVLTLSVTLAGIVFGSCLTIWPLGRAIYPIRLFAVSQAVIGLSTLIIMLLPTGFWHRALNTQNIVIQLGIISSLFLIPALMSGIAYPSVMAAVTSHYRLAARRVGFMTALNTFGGICGVILVAFIALPVIGLSKSVSAATLASIGISLIVIWTFEKRTVRPRTIMISLVMVALWALIPVVLKTRIPQDFLASKTQLIDYKEGLNSNLAVVRALDGITTLEIDRLWQGQKGWTHQIMAAHIPMILHREPRDICVVGVGVGQIAERFLYYPINHLTCVDIEKELYPLIKKHFSADWSSDPRVSLVVDDGKNYLKHSTERFDIISVEVGQTFRPGLASFYTKDFYAHAAKKLKSGGMLCQFVPLVFFTPTEYKALISTFISVFPNSILWYNDYEFILTGFTDAAGTLDPKRLTEATSLTKVKGDMEYAYWGGPAYTLIRKENFIGSIIMGPAGLKRFSKNAPLLCEDKPSLEYSISSHQKYSVDNLKDMVKLVKQYRENPSAYIATIHGDTIDASLISHVQNANLNNIIAQEYYQAYCETDITSMLFKAYALNPKNLQALYALTTYYTQQNDYPSAIKYSKETIENNPDDIHLYKLLSMVYQKADSMDRAMEILIKAVTVSPEAELYVTLGQMHMKRGDRAGAFSSFSKALELE
ncbi:MAG: fused MFS/spermidine synthase, partial [Chitinivibrionales bacterium]|nr:fused MFS/spermidine synthase [Chitinivibrionales bacterium]